MSHNAPERVYTPEPIQIHPGQAYSPAQGYQGPHTVVVYQAAPPQSWIRAHGTEIALGIGAAAAATAVLVALAVVLVALAVSAISVAIAVVIVKSVFEGGPDTKK